MKLFSHFAVTGFSNIYLVGPEHPGEAILIDPAVMDVELLKIIEGNGFYISSVLITHAHEGHIHGLKTLMRIYDTRIYAASPQVCELATHQIHGPETLSLAGFQVKTLEIPGHSNDSIVFLIDNMLFVGDVLSAGNVGPTPNGFARGLLLSAIREKILTLPDNTIILPGHGPISTVRAEKELNPFLSDKL